ncbi:AAEL014896-PA, partial [Aedes aegypti]
LRHCGFSSLPNNAFANTPNLVKLFLAHNSLTSLNALNFNGLSNLRHLDLSYISQDLLTGLIGYEQQVDPYNSLTEGLDLSEDVFAPLTNLSFLDVSYTKLLSYSARAFRSVAVIQLSLCYTGIPIIVGSMMNGSLKVLDISGNPGITTAIHHDASEARGFNANLEILVCENSTVKHLDWLNGMISLKVLLLGYNNINQLTNVTFANMESLEILDLSNNHVSNWHQRVFVSNENLFILDLSANNINVLTTEMLYDMATVEFLAIGQNSFVCHCLLREFIELAAKNSQAISSTTTSTISPSEEMHKSEGDYNVLFRVIHSYIIDFDEENYKCIDLDNSEFYLFEQERCTFDRTLLDNLNLGVAANTTTANIVKFTLMFFGFALVAFIIYISKWEYIKYFCIIVRNATVLSLLKHKNESLLRKQSLASVAGCYMYDVFVSYSEQDRQWVLDELLPNLERTEDIAVCLHERDFQVSDGSLK